MKFPKILALLAIALLAMLTGMEIALAEVYWVNGTISRSDTAGVLAGAFVVNVSNVTQFDTTDSNGFFNISGFYNSTNVSLRVNASGFTQGHILTIVVSGATNYTSTLTLTIVTPTNSAGASASITRDAATVTWTVSAVDNTSDNYVGTRVTYAASGVENFTTSWSNNTTSPSFSLSNLRGNAAYTAYIETYNRVNDAYKDIDTVTFSTLRVGTKSYWTPTAPAAKPMPPKSIIPSITEITSGTGKSKIIIVMIIAIVAIIAYYGIIKPGTKGKKKHK